MTAAAPPRPRAPAPPPRAGSTVSISQGRSRHLHTPETLLPETQTLVYEIEMTLLSYEVLRLCGSVFMIVLCYAGITLYRFFVATAKRRENDKRLRGIEVISQHSSNQPPLIE